jgi:GntR family carbon starvation induced transcriptional regulator
MNIETTARSRTERTCNRLREAIILAQFEPGQKLRIDQLGRDLEASTGAVREALSRLTAEGLVVAEPQKGFIVAPVSRSDLVDLTEVRIRVETHCLVESIRLGDLNWEGRILSLQHRLRALDRAWDRPGTPDAAQWHALHEEFHDDLASACPNAWWLRLRRHLFVQAERYRRLSKPIDQGKRDTTAEHDAIADAALARDAEAAAEALRQHLQRTADTILTSSLPFFEDLADG